LNINTNNYLHYNKSFKDVHNLDLVGGMSFQKESTDFSRADAQDFPSDAYRKLASGATKVDAATSSTENRLVSYLLRANHKYNDKYLLALSARADGSSRFEIGRAHV